VDLVGYKDNLNLYTYVCNDPLDKTDSTGNATDAMGNFAPAEGDEIQGYNYNPYLVVGAMMAAPIAAAACESCLGVGLIKVISTFFSKPSTAKTITRYMSKKEAKVARKTGNIPNVGKDGQPRPTHVKTDPPTSSAAEATKKYELEEAPPTHRATVPANRADDLGPAPGGKPNTSGGGSQNATNKPIPVKPCEISELCK
jgi:hypothetical protein